MKRKCTGRKTDGTPCGNWPIKGALVCRNHGGSSPQVKAKAAIRAELATWGLEGQATTVDPGETLLRLLSQSVWRSDKYAHQIAQLVEQNGGDIVAALTGTQKVLNSNGNLVAVGEYIGAMAQLENQERDRSAKYSEMALRAGLAERQVRLAEQQGMLIERVLTAVFDGLALDQPQRVKAVAIITEKLNELAG